METEIKITTILKASNGMILSNGEAYGKTVALGVTDKAENWYEISEEAYQKILEQETQNIE